VNLPYASFCLLTGDIRAIVITFFVFAMHFSLAHFYPSCQSALRVPGFICARRWKKGKLEQRHDKSIRCKYNILSIYQISQFLGSLLSRISPVLKIKKKKTTNNLSKETCFPLQKNRNQSTQ